MSHNLDSYRKNAAAARIEATAASLANVRARAAEAAARWEEMADKLEWVEEQSRIKRNAAHGKPFSASFTEETPAS